MFAPQKVDAAKDSFLCVEKLCIRMKVMFSSTFFFFSFFHCSIRHWREGKRRKKKCAFCCCCCFGRVKSWDFPFRCTRVCWFIYFLYIFFSVRVRQRSFRGRNEIEGNRFLNLYLFDLWISPAREREREKILESMKHVYDADGKKYKEMYRERINLFKWLFFFSFFFLPYFSCVCA